MSLASAPLPTDPDALRMFAIGLQAELARKDIEIAANAAEIYAKTLHIEKLKMQLAVLRRARFGQSSEKLDRDIEQLELLIGELEEEQAEGDARASAADPAQPDPAQTRERKQPVRKPLPPHLPRETVAHEPPCICPGCGSTVFSRMGQDEREVLEYVPSSFKVIQHVRPKLSCRACETVVQQPMPALPIERGRPGPGLIAHVLVSKYCDHLPLHRQAGIYAREGVELDRSTLADWVGQATFLLSPLAEAIGRHIRAGAALHADDTTVPVLAPGLGKTKTGRLWVVVRDERPSPLRSVCEAAGGGATGGGLGRAASRILSLLGRPQRHSCPSFAWLLPGVPARRRLRRVRHALRPDHAGRRPAAGRGRLLEPRTPEVLRRPPCDGVADRPRGLAADRSPVRHRKRH
jgi:transposase